MNLRFAIAETSDATKLTQVSIEAFHTDFTVAGRESAGGPPGYDSIDFHEKMILESSKFYKVLVDDSIAGAFWFNVTDAEEAYLYRVFIDPAFHKMGIGLKIFQFLFQNFSNIKCWQLKVPSWNTRTPSFYTKLGFRIIETTEKFLFFSKSID